MKPTVNSIKISTTLWCYQQYPLCNQWRVPLPFFNVRA